MSVGSLEALRRRVCTAVFLEITANVKSSLDCSQNVESQLAEIHDEFFHANEAIDHCAIASLVLDTQPVQWIHWWQHASPFAGGRRIASVMLQEQQAGRFE